MVPPACGRPWTSAPCAEELVKDERSCLILGGPGTGKTYLLRKLYDYLVSNGSVVQCTSKTRVACSLLPGAVTLNRLSHQAPPAHNSWLIVDEISMIDTAMFSTLSRYSFIPGVKFILCGDYNQNRPVSDVWLGCENKTDSEFSDLLWDLCQGTVVKLTENKRSDPALFDFCRYLTSDQACCAAKVDAAMQKFPISDREASVMLVLSHRLRMSALRGCAGPKQGTGAPRKHTDSLYTKPDMS